MIEISVYALSNSHIYDDDDDDDAKNIVNMNVQFTVAGFHLIVPNTTASLQ